MTTLKNVLDNSVFNRTPRGLPMNDVLAVLFHRSAATLYLIYVFWAAISIVGGIPSVIHGLGGLGQIIFSVIVICTAGPACFGATFWPNMARLELFAGSSFIMSMLIYIFFLIQSTIQYGSSISSIFLALSFLVLPIARTAIVIVFLLRQTQEKVTGEI